MNAHRLRVLCAMALGSVMAAAASADQPALISSIQLTAERALRHEIPAAGAHVIVHAQSLDPRLRLAECDRPLSATIAGDGQPRAHTTVAVRCDGAMRWTIYVSVSIESEFAVLVASHALARDAEIGAADFELQTRHLPGLTTDYVSAAAALAGQRLRRPLASGEALSLEALTPTNVIHRGQEVTLIAGAGGFQVRVSAIALSDGRLSDRIRVQNLSSQRVVEGIVRSDSVVEVPL